MERLEWTPGERRTRRWVRGRGPRVDLRRALAHSVRTGGDVSGCRAERRARERPLVLLCDISGSMERYSRLLLHFAHALGRRRAASKSFVFSTGLTRVTHELGPAGSTRPSPTSHVRRPAGPVAPASATRCGSSINSGRAACSTAARSCCSSRTAGTAATRIVLREQIKRAAAQLPSPDLAQPADRHARLRPADAWTAGRVAVRRRLPAGPDADQSRGPGATLEPAPRSGLTAAGIPGSDSFEPVGEKSHREGDAIGWAQLSGGST